MLKKSFRTIAEIKADTRLEMDRSEYLFRLVENYYPDRVDATYTISPIGPNTIRIFLELKQDAPKAHTRDLVKAMKKALGVKKAERFFRDDDGRFAWKVEAQAKPSEPRYMIFIENAHSNGCKIIKKRKMKTVYVSDCGRKKS